MITSGLVLPRKLDIDTATLTPQYGKFVAEPFERGYGHTVGHSLRRILLSSLEGAAVTAVRVKGALHEYSTVKGVREDVINIVLNLKQLRLKMYSPGPEILKLKTKKSGEIKAKDIEANNNVEILTPDLFIATVEPGSELEMEIEVGRGRGYMSADRMKKEGQPLGTIFVDALFSPVMKVQYEVENARVGQMTDYDRLILEIWTDGSVEPANAMAYAAQILKDSLTVFIDFDGKEDSQPKEVVQDEGQSRLKEMLGQSVDIIELSVRASNCLKAAKIQTIKELVVKTDEELLSFKNFGKKSLDEIKDRLKDLGLQLGMQAPN
ncbi:MAG TPA: DNA-directed RNA polymerase subunit alpha [Elusimicrobiota bacterium]|nr:DNA-directed RNA polymerase subunit alpha [Elusimicrobiota bacterium]